jgi:hypothetical protein
MGKKNPAVEEARDLRGALEAIGRVIGDGSITPKARLQQAAGILSIYEVRCTVAQRVVAKPGLFDVPAGTGE